MKKARLILSASLIALMGVSTLSLSSCSKDDTDCPVGYTGSNCDQEIRAAMLGTYSAKDINNDDPGDVQIYNANITSDATVSKVDMHNFGNFFLSDIVVSDVQKSGSNINFTIGAQKPDGDYTVSGQGTYNASSKTINITYTLMASDGTTLSYTGSWTQN